MSVSSIDNISSLISTIQASITQFDPTLYTSMTDSYTDSISTSRISTSRISTSRISTSRISTSINKAALSKLFKQISYLTMTSSLRDYPYEFSDDLVLLSENQLENMSLNDLIKYNNNVSTSAAFELSTMVQNQAIKNQYDIMIMLSKSTIDGLDYELQINRGKQVTNNNRKKYLYDQSTMYISSISTVERDISSQQYIIDMTESSISGIRDETGLADSTIAGQTIEGISTGKGYSSIYFARWGGPYASPQVDAAAGGGDGNGEATETDAMPYFVSRGFTGKLKETTSSIDATSTSLNEYIATHARAYQCTIDAETVQRNKSDDLNTLYIRRGQLESLVISKGIAERKAIGFRDSTLSAINTLSSMYTLTDLTYKYNISLSTSRAIENAYINRLSTFTQADIAYNNSIPQSGGANITPILGNTILWTARSMAQTALETASTNKIVADSDVVQRQKLANIANTDQYNTVIEELSKTVMSKIRYVDKVRKYKESTSQRVVYFSSIYETSIRDMEKYNSTLKSYSSFYESSLIGLTDIRLRNREDTDTIDREKIVVDELSFSIPYLRKTYDDSVNSTRKYIRASSLYTGIANTERDNMSTILNFYESTSKGVDRLKNRIRDLSDIIWDNDMQIFVHSTILNSEQINLEKFAVQIIDSVNTQERATYEYRETICREKRIALQGNYEAKVLAAIKDAGDETKRLQALTPNVTVTPVIVNLNTQTITNARTPFNTITTFLSYFNAVYTAYDNHSVNINSLSTNIGAKYNCWSTLKVYDSDNYYSNPRIPSIQNKVTNLNTDFSAAKDFVYSIGQAYTGTLNGITTVKEYFRTSYADIFTVAERNEQDTLISSFIIEGYTQAIALLAQNGVVVNI